MTELKKYKQVISLETMPNDDVENDVALKLLSCNRSGRLYQKRLLFFVLTVFSVLRLGLFLRMPYNAIENTYYDDYLLLSLADFLSNGWWLGNYTHATLVKGISFPLFVAFSNIFSVPYSLLLGLLYIAAAVSAFVMLHSTAKNNVISSLGYLLILYSPVGFSDQVTQRLYRNAIIFPVVVILICLAVLLYNHRDRDVGSICFFAIMEGLCFSFFYYIREDSIWIVPFVICSSLVSIVWLIGFSKFDKKETIKRASVYIVPILVFLVITAGYKAINYHSYGVFLTNDRTEGTFADFIGNVIKVTDEDNSNPDIWISKRKLEKVVDALPSICDKKDVFLSTYDTWGQGEDIAGDIPIWVVRDALAKIGYFSSAQDFQNKCTILNDELLDAVNKGTLELEPAIYFSNQARGIHPEEIPDILSKSIRNLFELVSYKEAQSSEVVSSGHESEVRFMHSITSTGRINPDTYESVIDGWLILKTGAIQSSEIDLESAYPLQFNTWGAQESMEFLPEYPLSNRIYFSLTSDYAINCEHDKIHIQLNGIDYGLIPIQDGETEDMFVHINRAQSVSVPDPNRDYSGRAVSVGNIITGIYKHTGLLLFLVSMIIHVALFVRWLIHKTWATFEPVIILFGISASAFIAVFGVTVFTGTWLPMLWYYASEPVLSTLLCFELLAIGYAYSALSEDVFKKGVVTARTF